MSAALDNAFQQQRIRLRNAIERAVAVAWMNGYRDREAVKAQIIATVDTGTRASATLVDAYMTQTLRELGDHRHPKGLDVAAYTVSALRGVDAEEVYDRPFGALGGQLAEGVQFGQALLSGQASVQRLASTDLQIAHSHAARDWMADDKRVGSYRRVLSPGKNCELCIAAADRIYHKADLLPIHEHCGCSVSPVLGDEVSDSLSDAIAIVPDPELGSRLADPSWQAAA